MWANGQESTTDESFSATEQSRIATFRNGGGHLMVSGSEIGWDLDRDTGPTAADRSFYNTHLKADFGGNGNDDSASYTVAPVAGGLFAGRAAASFDNGSLGLYRVQTPDTMTPSGPGATAALSYNGVAPEPPRSNTTAARGAAGWSTLASLLKPSAMPPGEANTWPAF